MDEIRVAQAQADEAFAVAALHLQAGIAAGGRPRPGYLDELADWWLRRRATAPAWLAHAPDGDPVGLLAAQAVPVRPSTVAPAGHRLEVDLLFVPPAWRRRGIGSRLVTAAQTYARTTGARELRSPARPDNQGILEALGFVATPAVARAWLPEVRVVARA